MQIKLLPMLIAMATLTGCASAPPAPPPSVVRDPSSEFVSVSDGKKCNSEGERRHSVKNTHTYRTIEVFLQWDVGDLTLVKKHHLLPQQAMELECSFRVRVKSSSFTDF